MFRLTHSTIRPYRNSIFLAAVVLFAALQFSGCQMTSADGGTPPPAAPSATFSFCDKEAPSCDNETSFSATATRDLEVKVSWQNVPAGRPTLQLPGLEVVEFVKLTVPVKPLVGLMFMA